MGNADSTFYATNIDAWKNPQNVPKYENGSSKPQHDSLYGFDQREERVRTVSEEDMYWAKLPPNKRDYCAHHFIDLQRCRKENYPFLGKCEHYKHDWDHCQNQDIIYRMKEYERERRLLQREERKKAKEAFN